MIRTLSCARLLAMFLLLVVAPAAAPTLSRAGGKGGDGSNETAETSTDPDMVIESIYVSMDERRFADAIRMAEELTKGNPEYARGWGMLAMLKFGMRDQEGAEMAMTRARRIDEHCPELVILMANQQANAGDLDGAEKLVAEALGTHENSFELRMLHGDILGARRAFQAAVTVYSNTAKLAKSERQKLTVLIKAGQAAVAAEMWDITETAFTAALSLKENPQIRFLRADSRLKGKNFVGSMEDCRLLAANAEVAANAQARANVENMRSTVEKAWAAEKGPIEPLAWQLRYQPGDAALEARIIQEVKAIRAGGDEHPFKDLVLRPEIVLDTDEGEEQKPLTEEEKQEMEKYGYESEESYRSIKAISKGMQDHAEAVRRARIEIPEELTQKRSEVEDSFLEKILELEKLANWDNVLSFCDERARVYPSSTVYLARSRAWFWKKDYQKAIDQADLALGMEALEISEDQDRPIRQGLFGSSLYVQIGGFRDFCEHLGTNTLTEDEAATVKAMELEAAGEYVAAFTTYRALVEKVGGWMPYYISVCKSQFEMLHIDEVVLRLVEDGNRKLTAGDNEAAFAIEEQVGGIYGSNSPEKFVYQMRCTIARNEEVTDYLIDYGFKYGPEHAGMHLVMGRYRLAKDERGLALLHFNAGARGLEASELSGDAKTCAEERGKIEEAVGAAGRYKFYSESVNVQMAEKNKSRNSIVSALCVPCFTRLMALGGKRLELLPFRSQFYMKGENYAAAIVDAKQVLQEFPEKKSWALGMLGDCNYNSKQYREAAEAYAQYVELNPDNVGATAYCGFSWYHAKENDKAFPYFLKATEMESKDPFVYMELAEIYAERDDLSAACDFALKASTMATEQGRSGLALRASGSAMKWAQKNMERILGQ